MKTEEEVLRLFAEENPVPESALHLDESDSHTDHLSAPTGRNSRVIDMDKSDKDNRRPWVSWVAAAALLVVAGTIALIIAANTDDTDLNSDEPLASAASSIPTTTTRPSTTVTTEPAVGSIGTLLMEFNDMALEATFEDCSLEPLLNDESFRAGGLRLDANAADGTEWQVSAMLNFREPGDFQFEAVGPDGQPNLLAWPDQPGTTIESEISEVAAVFNTQFFDRGESSETQAADIPLVVTIACN